MNSTVHRDDDLLRYRAGDRSGPLSRLLTERALSPVFQPIVSIADGRIHAHEALIRGPRGMPLHTPDALLAAARREGLLQDFEVACVVFALERWRELGRGGKLFVNVSASALVQCFGGHSAEQLVACIRGFGLDPGAIVFEITEHERVGDVPLLIEVASTVHAAGMAFALDDFGDGRSSLRLWSELSPDTVKIDKYFTHDLARHGRKLQTLKALMQIADTFGSTLVAEGVETEDELRVLRDLGVGLAQGYFLGRPAELPREIPAPEAVTVLGDPRVAVMPTLRSAATPRRLRVQPTVRAESVTPATTNDRVYELFHANPAWHAIAIVEEERPVGLLGRQQFLDLYAKRYFPELYGRKHCIAFANTTPTLIEVEHDIEDLLAVLTSPDQRYLTEGFIYTDNGRYHGLGTGHQLVRNVTESRIEAARHANPLTFLPGNIPISEHIERLLASESEFAAVYADLKDFKPFNDYYGYWQGDAVIKLLAERLQAHTDPRRDFVGHVGGDDFVVLFQSEDWRERCETIIADFNEHVIRQYDPQAQESRGITTEDRDGVQRRFPFTTLYMGAVPLRGGHGGTASSVASAAARAKQMAKVRGAGLVVESHEPSVRAAPIVQA